MNTTEYKLIRSSRKTISAQIKDGQLIVRAPLRCPERQIREFLEKHHRWIENHLQKSEEAARQARNSGRISEQELRELADKAVEYIPQRVRYYAGIMGVSYGRITIRAQKTRWGSCSARGNLNFNCLLMLTPPEVIDSVVVHELAHRFEMNHSPRFYAHVLAAYPEYETWNTWLKKNGQAVMKRLF